MDRSITYWEKQEEGETSEQRSLRSLHFKNVFRVDAVILVLRNPLATQAGE